MDNINPGYKICPNCNQYVNVGVRFCGNCNYVFEQTQYYQQQTMYQQPYMHYYQQQQQQPQPGPRTVVCEKCGQWYDYSEKRCPKCNKAKPQSGLSVAAQILAILAFFLPMWLFLGLTISFASMVVGVIDLAIGDKKKRHTGAYDGIIVFALYVIFAAFGIGIIRV